MKLLLAEKSSKELMQEYEKLIELERTNDEPKDDWDRIWLKALKARRSIIEMALTERKIKVQED